MNADGESVLDLARKVLRTEAAAILGLVDRLNGDFERADQIRAGLAGQGIIVEDTKEGVRWKRQ